MDFPRAAAYGRRVLDRLLAAGLAPGDLINVNIPDLSQGPPRGIRVVRQSVAGIEEAYEARKDPRGRDYFWLTDNYSFKQSPDDTDVVAIREGYIAVTPLHVDLTATGRLAQLAAIDWSGATGEQAP
jgi:5'-nucleotidase